MSDEQKEKSADGVCKLDTHYSSLITHYSQLITHYSLLGTDMRLRNILAVTRKKHA